MEESSKKILMQLSQRGYRITDARKSVVEALLLQAEPITIKDLTKLVSSDEASVYRTIGVLVEEQIAEEVQLSGGVTRYAISHGHHHHAVCTSCGLVAHVPCDFVVSITSQKNIPKQFTKINEHTVTLYGICTSCTHSSQQP